ncbi:hypothetical protein OQA88_7438 [Cercophora sp. LCS_1]
MDTDVESPLINGYISPLEDTGPLHCRRTLDQYSYYMLETTERRDKDQVVYRWAEKQRKANQLRDSTSWETGRQVGSTSRLALGNLPSNDSALRNNSTPIVMIDQLWLWVLPNGTVITSLPNTHRQSERYNIRTLLSREIERNQKRSAIRGPEDLVGIVLETCLDVMTREGPSGVKLQECFQSSINAIAEDEAVAMEKFLRSVDNLAKAKDPFLLTEEIDSFSKISTESNRLVEIIDIRDELDIIKSVLTTQKKVLKQLRDAVRSEERASSSSTSSTSENPDAKCSPSEVKSDVKASKAYGDTAFRNLVAVEDALWIVDDNLTRVKEMDDSATRVHDSLKQLLDFKQQQASGWESRYAKKLSEQGQRQNTIMIIFTVVTIIFLPMSFIASFFAINIDQFPKDLESGEPDWPLSTVASYIFGISIAFSGAILLIVAIFFLSMAHQKHRRRRRHLHDPSSRHHHHHPRLTPTTMRGMHTRSAANIHHREKDPGQSDPDDSDYGTSISSATDDDEREYAYLFGRWDWHTRIPFIRRLWLWKLYRIRGQRHRLRRSQEGVEWDYPLSRWRGWVVWVIRRRRRRRRRNQREDDDCDSDDENARNYRRGAEHRWRVKVRREWLGDAVKGVGGWFGFGKRRKKDEEDEEDEVRGDVRISLKTVFRRRQRMVDEEMEVGNVADRRLGDRFQGL